MATLIRWTNENSRNRTTPTGFLRRRIILVVAFCETTQVLAPGAFTLHFESVADGVSRSYSDEVLQWAELSNAKPYGTKEHPASPPRDGPKSPEPELRWKLIPLDFSSPRLTRSPRDLLGRTSEEIHLTLLASTSTAVPSREDSTAAARPRPPRRPVPADYNLAGSAERKRLGIKEWERTTLAKDSG